MKHGLFLVCVSSVFSSFHSRRVCTFCHRSPTIDYLAPPAFRFSRLGQSNETRTRYFCILRSPKGQDNLEEQYNLDLTYLHTHAFPYDKRVALDSSGQFPGFGRIKPNVCGGGKEGNRKMELLIFFKLLLLFASDSEVQEQRWGAW